MSNAERIEGKFQRAKALPIYIGCMFKRPELSRAVCLGSGGDLLSRAVASQVPSARGGLTAVFGKGTGGTLQP